MRASVLAALPSFSTKFEGELNYMYTDVKGLVTTGIGDLIDPVGAATGLAWKHADGSAASTAEVEAEWQKVKDAWPNVQSVADRSITTLHLDQPDIDNLVAEKAHANDALLRSQFPDFDNWPADAQLALHSMAWAQGASFGGWPHLLAALNASPADFLAAAGTPGDAGADTTKRGQAWLNDTGNPGLRPRNLANKVLWQNAARVVAGGLDPETLYYPTELAEGVTAPPGGAWRTVGEVLLVLLVLGAGGYAAWHFSPAKTQWKGAILRDARLAERVVAAKWAAAERAVGL